MSAEETADWLVVDRDRLPEMFPTHHHSPEFWEHLGRAIASFGFLEEVLGKAIFAFSANRRYRQDQLEAAYRAWLPKLGRALTDPLTNLAESYGKATQEHPETTTENVSDLVEQIKKAAIVRNALCHGSWPAPNSNGASIPLFVNRRMEVWDTPIDVAYLCAVQDHVAELSCNIIDTVTHMGWQFPGRTGPGKRV